MLRPSGWSDAELLALLKVLRLRMVDYIYAAEQAFVKEAQRQFQSAFGITKTAAEITQAVREILRSFQIALGTRAFQNEEIAVGSTKVYVHQHLYETMCLLMENRRGGVWHPDELKLQLTKFKTYRRDFDLSQKEFFKHVQIIPRSLKDVREKFYLWRDIYLEDKKKASEIVQSDAELQRMAVLEDIFEGVPPPLPSMLSPPPSTPTSVHLQAKPSPSKVASATAPKPANRKKPNWTPEDLELLVSLVTQITIEKHKTGTSSSVVRMSSQLNRTEASILRKLLEIRKHVLCNSASPKAASLLPSVVYDEQSDTHKIFTADWNDRDDPYALGYIAIRDCHNDKQNKRKRTQPPPLRMEMRPRTETRSDSTPTAATPTVVPSANGKVGQQQIHPPGRKMHGKPPRAPPSAYSEFVRDCAAIIKWSEKRTYELCTALRDLIRTHEIRSRAFYRELTEALGDNASLLDVQVSCERIIHHCNERYGSHGCLAAAIEGSDVIQPSPSKSGVWPPFEGPTSTDDSPVNQTATISEGEVRRSKNLFRSKQQPSNESLSGDSFGKSRDVYNQQSARCQYSTAENDATPSSPMSEVSPNAYDYDEYSETIQINNDNEPHSSTGKRYLQRGIQEDVEEDEIDVETQSLSSSNSYVSSDYGKNDRPLHARNVHAIRSRHERSDRRSSRMPRGKVQVSSQKTVVFAHTSHYCDGCYRQTRNNYRRVDEGHGEGGKRMRNSIGDSGDHDSSDEESQRALAEMDSIWAETIMGPVERINAEVEAKLQEQEERKQARKKAEQKKQRKLELRALLEEEYEAKRQQLAM